MYAHIVKQLSEILVDLLSRKIVYLYCFMSHRLSCWTSQAHKQWFTSQGCSLKYMENLHTHTHIKKKKNSILSQKGG